MNQFIVKWQPTQSLGLYFSSDWFQAVTAGKKKKERRKNLQTMQCGHD